ncbi:hypothetical protein [Teredinibacter franksiae]|uniref:hypothetical protein n=1 Tax=Teredinibacter franksiae TaxID=2761453 RepID=UPI001FE3E248|nr:hypothetical protein [Teredinibacter franksiae]
MPERDWWNAIDPAVVADKKGDGWMAFGSFWGGLKWSSWTKTAEPQEWYSIAKRQIQLDENGNDFPQQIEAPFIHQKLPLSLHFRLKFTPQPNTINTTLCTTLCRFELQLKLTLGNGHANFFR